MIIRNTNPNQPQQNNMVQMPYRDKSGRSNIRSVAYDELETQIIVTFKDGSSYLYTNTSAGASTIKNMCLYARIGNGLNSYISRIVKKNYQAKLA